MSTSRKTSSILSHSEGFPEDNPATGSWPKLIRQCANGMRTGIPFSTSPGTAFEYSNFGFAILGQIIAKASGRPYEVYLRDNILKPLGMNSSTLEMTGVPREQIALGYRWENNAWKPEPILAHGSFRRQIAEASAWGSCRVGEPLSGNGTRNSSIRLVCDNGPLSARIALDVTTHKLTSLDLVPLRETTLRTLKPSQITRKHHCTL